MLNDTPQGKIKTDAVTKFWLFRYSRFGKETWMDLGPNPDVSLSETRELATRAQWSEFDLERNIWVVPAERMQSKRSHRVPLSAAAVATLTTVKGLDNTCVFPGHKLKYSLVQWCHAAGSEKAETNQRHLAGISPEAFERASF